MKKGQIIEGIVERTDFPNKGILRTEEGTCTVKNALPGQRVRCSVSKAHGRKAEGRLLEVLAAAPAEGESPCPHFGACGSCLYLTLPYEEQLKIKEGQVKRLLDSVLCKPKKEDDWNAAYLFEGIKPSPAPFGYRNKMEFSFGDEVKDGPLSLGMHRRGSFYDIVSVTDCRIVDDDYRRILGCVLDYFRDLQEKGVPVSFYHRLRHTGYLRHLLVRKGAATGEILVALVTTTQYGTAVPCADYAGAASAKTEFSEAPSAEAAFREVEAGPAESEVLEGLKDALLALRLDGSIVGILHTRNDAVADVVQSDETRTLYGRDFFYEEILGLRFRISQFSFFQTNSRGAEVLYQTAREYIGKYIAAGDSGEADQKENGEPDRERSSAADAGKIVYDLYSGTGTIAQLMAPVAKKVIGVEIVEEAVEAARQNAALNGLHNCEFIAGDVLKVLDEIAEKPDVIILDPPRDGVHPKALKKILDYGVAHILYISCKPTSLVRDLEAFLEKGYRVERAVAVDMFPWTSGVECVCLLSKLNVGQHIEVGLGMGEIKISDQLIYNRQFSAAKILNDL